MNDMIVRNQILVQVVFPQGGERMFPLVDILNDNEEAAAVSDADMIARSARWLDRDVADFANMIVTRPRTGNILIAPKPIYGGAFETLVAGSLIAILVFVSAAIGFLLIPLISAIGGWIIGWGLSEVFPFAGTWIVDGAASFGLDWNLSTLPVAATFIGFVSGFFRHTQKVKHEKD